MRIGANYLGNNRCLFRVWAPHASAVDLRLLNHQERLTALKSAENGCFQVEVEDVPPGTLYLYRLDGGKERPDPGSRFQPRGVHGPSAVVDPSFAWQDECWFGLPLQNYIVYELHVGAFTQDGTFEAIIPHLAALKELGVTAVELMPVAQFPGSRNWGYDGAYPFAAQNSYGGPLALKTFVNACHREKLAVVLDVVYNHLGPEGNYLADFGPYFTERYKTPWGLALNFDGPESDHVRRFFIDNALYWIEEFHIDGLRLDAVHAILDHSPYTFIEELGENIHAEAARLNRQVFLFPESAANDARLVRSRELGGYGLDAQWNDDFHHALRGVISGEASGYYKDYGEFRQLVKAYREGFVYCGEYSRYRRRRHGTSARDIPAKRFVVFCQNHDQVGNRMSGERLSRLVCFETLKLAAGTVLLSPFIPLLFMGEEYGEQAPFSYFVSHSDAALIEAVRQGRRAEFATFGWQTEPPDPQDENTFLQAKLNHRLRGDPPFRTLWEFYRELIRLRKELAPLARLSKDHCEVNGFEDARALTMRRWTDEEQVFTVFNFNDAQVSISITGLAGQWKKVLDSTDKQWQGKSGTLPGILEAQPTLALALPPRSLALFVQDRAHG
ncbi:MAG TPA: malto-oligosyltrehalose trehalohydrolase [Candidatus Binatia bacterium]|nr:malto-oligosyltrehalose trehalohydrolase [Candidatus Binatia bacterium]